MIAFAVAARCEEEQQVRGHPDSARDHRGNRHRQRVMMLHVGKFVRQYLGDVPFREQTQQATRDGNRGVATQAIYSAVGRVVVICVTLRGVIHFDRDCRSPCVPPTLQSS